MNLRLIAALALAGASALAAGPKDKEKTKQPVTRPAPQFLIDTTPIDREATMRVSFAPVVKRVQSSVVYISSTKQVKSRDMSQLFQDPNFRKFFGPMLPNPGQGGGGDGSGSGGGGGSGRAPKTEKQESLGSGVIISTNGYVLTNNHVVEGADEVKVRFGEPRKEFKAAVIGRDSEADVAVLKIEATGLPAATLGDSDQLQVGDTVLAIGDPFDIGLTVTHGIVSALGRNNLQLEAFEDFIQTDAPINPGNSGGALLDTQGRVVGINTAILSHSGGSNGVGFSIPINLVRSIADQLIRTGKVSRGFLGVTLNPEITPDLAEEFGAASGALVADVQPDSPAEKAGIQSGDIITKLNGKAIADTPQLRLAISELIPGTTVSIEYIRKGKTSTVSAKLGDRAGKSLAGGDSDKSAAGHDDSGVLNGVAVTDITPEAREELKLPASIRGALISDVEQDSASADSLQKGDVILDLDHKAVHNADEAIKLSAQIPGPKVLVRFWRSGATQYAVIDESKKSK
jgi:serine protease Do